MPASPLATGPVSAASPLSSALSSAAVSSGRSTAPGSGTPAARSTSAAEDTRVTRWLAPCASPACHSGRDGSSMRTATPPRARTISSPRCRAPSAAVTPKNVPGMRSRSAGVPEKVIAGCSAIPVAPCLVAGSSTSRPEQPLTCRTVVPAPTASAAASSATTQPRASSETASTSSSAACATAAGSATGTPGSRDAARARDASDRADTAVTGNPARRNAPPSAEPARPAPMMPTWGRQAPGEVVARRGRQCGGESGAPTNSGPRDPFSGFPSPGAPHEGANESDMCRSSPRQGYRTICLRS